MKKYILLGSLLAVFIGYSLYKGNNSDNKANTTTTPVSDVTAPTDMKKTYKDGSYTGVVADAYYGNLQVKAIISGGKLTDVQFLDYPQKDNTSRKISGDAMPKLKTEAIIAQSAKVNGISGATQTVEAFVVSLDSALALAQK